MLQHADPRAKRIVQQASQLLTAQVALVDGYGTKLAESTPDGLKAHDGKGAVINVPIEVDEEALQLVISEPLDGGVISPRLVRMIVSSMDDQSNRTIPSLDPDVKRTMVLQLLQGSSGDPRELRRKADILGVDLSIPRAVVLVEAVDYIHAESQVDPEIRAKRRMLRARHVISSIVAYFRLPSDAICSYLGEGEIAILKASTAHDLELWTREDAGAGSSSWANLEALKRACGGLLHTIQRDTGTTVNVGIGRYHPGLEGLPRSYADARAALEIGRQLRGSNRLHCLDELGAAAFMGVSDFRTKSELAAHLLSPLRGARELLETLEVFFDEDCCPTSTSQRLGIHRNTLTYRLDKVKQLSGLDPRRFDDAVQIRLASVVQGM
jgi:carbohydrate diacid regulator